MTLPKIKDTIQRFIDGLKTVQGSVIDPKFLDSGILHYRAEIAYRNYKRDGGLNDLYYQRINLLPNISLQYSAPSGSILMTQPQQDNKPAFIPSFIKLGVYDGIQYCGSRDGHAWIRIKNRQQLSNLLANKITNPKNNPCLTYFLWAPANRWMEIYNDSTVGEGMMYAVVADPSQVTEYNKDTDDFPMDEGDLVELIELMKKDLIEGKAFKPAIEWDKPTGNAEHPFKINPTQAQ